MKKVLIITYYWPPAGGPSVQRVLKFAKYLPEFGWEPIILTVEKGEFFAIDPSLVKEVNDFKVYRSRNWEPGFIYRKLSGMKQNEPIPVGVLEKPAQKWGQKLSHWIRRNIFIPDAKIGWYPHAVHLGKKIIKNNHPHIIFSSSPPPTVHLIARTLSHKFNLPFIADFRDPWSDIYYYKIHPRLSIAEKLDRQLEQKVFRDADHLIFISNQDLQTYCSNNSSKCHYIPNGYDETDFQEINIIKKTYQFIITHLGSLNLSRFPEELFKALNTIRKTQPQMLHNLRIRFIGTVDSQVKAMIQKMGFAEHVEYLGYLPHKEALQKAAESSILLLVNVKSPDSKRIVAGKTFEYLRLRKPIIAITPPEGELAQLLSNFERMYCTDFGDANSIQTALLREYRLWNTGQVLPTELPEEIKQFERRYLTGRLADVFGNIID